MKITFIRPHSTVQSAAPPMAFLSLSAYLRAHGNHQINIIDGRAKLLNAEKIKPLLQEENPDLIGITAFSLERQEAYNLAAMAKSLYPQVPVVIGGPLPTSDWENTASDPNIDYAVLAEGELTLQSLVESLEAGEKYPVIKGLAYKQNGEVRCFGFPDFIADLDIIPMPAWDMIDLDFYFNNKLKRSSMNPHQKSSRSAPLITTRGCPYQCTYCHNVFGKMLRKRSVESVIEEISYLKRANNVEDITAVPK